MDDFQNRSGARVELLIHQMRRAMNDVDLEAEVLQAVRAFESEQTAANHRSAPLPARVLRHAMAIFERAKPEDAGLHASVTQSQARQRRNEGAAAGRDDQVVVGLVGAVGAEHAAGKAKDANSANTRMQPDAVALVPGEGIELDFDSPAAIRRALPTA